MFSSCLPFCLYIIFVKVDVLITQKPLRERTWVERFGEKFGETVVERDPVITRFSLQINMVASQNILFPLVQEITNLEEPLNFDNMNNTKTNDFIAYGNSGSGRWQSFR